MIREVHNKHNPFDQKILEKTPFIYSMPGILKADKRLRNKYRVHSLVAELFDLARAHGYAYCSNQFLAEKMGVSIDTVKRDLTLLEDCGYIRRDTKFKDFKRQRKIYVVDIFSNNFYQGAKLHQPSVQECPKEESLSPNGDSKCISKDIHKGVAKAPSSFSFSPESEEICEILFKRISGHGRNVKDPRKSQKTWNDWKKEITYMIRRDKLEPEEIKKMIHFAHDHDFWFKNISSPKSLRKNWDKLQLATVSKKKETQEDIISRNRKESEKIRKILLSKSIPRSKFLIECYHDNVQIGAANHPHRNIIEYKEKAFKSLLEHQLRRYNVFHHISEVVS